MEEANVKIDALRAQIDSIDREIVAKLNERAKLVLEIKLVKVQSHLDLYDPQREEKIFENVAGASDGPMYDDSIRAVYEEILKEMKALESR